MKTSDSVTLMVPNELAYFDLAQLYVREMAKKIGFRGNSLNQIDIAVEESVTFVMKHGYDKEESSTIEVICQKLDNGIRIIVKDMGIPFDPHQIARFNITKNIEDMETEGLWIYMLSKVVDDLSFKNLGHLGKEIHMIKYLPQNVLEDTLPPDEAELLEDTAAPVGKIEYEIRRMLPEEAIEVSRCAYKSHGYSFFDDHIYYPERLVEMNSSLEMISVVAVTKDNEFMGHTALVFQNPEDTIAELTFAFVNVEYRGQGALNRMTEFLLQVPKKRKLTGIYAYAVANHPFTQKSLMKYNLKDCGILLATSPASWKFKGISDDTSQRISVVLSFRYLKQPSELILFPPLHHRDMVMRLYDSLGAIHQFHEPELKEPVFKGADSAIYTFLNELESCGEIFVTNYGDNIIRVIRKNLRSFCVQQVSSIILFLKLTDPLTYHLTAEFEKMGFFFAGILPDSMIGDALVLQYLNNVEFDYGKLVIYQDSTKEILAYIQAHDPNENL
ncbi:MAG: ATP-binding protein [Bacteroidales bacterium]|nr:ATP-binding protein [Lentimicrobiaceae bacterium]MDD5695015.1 ATP-binding protein [Bacteroidales bacterium]